VKLEIDNNLIEHVNQFKYLRITLTADGRCPVVLRQIIVMAKRAFTLQKNRQLLTNEKLNIKTRKNISQKLKMFGVYLYIWL